MSKRVREQGNPPPPSYCVARWGARHLVLLGVVGSKASQCWWRFSLVFMRILFFSVCSFVLIILMMTWVGWLFVYFFLLGFIIVGYRSFVFNFSSFSLYSLLFFLLVFALKKSVFRDFYLGMFTFLCILFIHSQHFKTESWECCKFYHLIIFHSWLQAPSSCALGSTVDKEIYFCISITYHLYANYY